MQHQNRFLITNYLKIMGKNKKNWHGAKPVDERKVERFLKLMDQGEELGEKLMALLSEFGSSMDGLLVETYALCKAHGALKAIAEDKGFDADQLYDMLLPSFMAEMRNELEKK